MSENKGKVIETVDLEDMKFDKKLNAYKYPCPCGGKFLAPIPQIESEAAKDKDSFVVKCQSCSNCIKVDDIAGLDDFDPEF